MSGLNANQVFKWRRAFEKGEPVEPYAALLPVSISSSSEPASAVVEQLVQKSVTVGTIHIELLGRARISVQSGADPALLRCILEVLSKLIELPPETRIRLTAGATEMRRGFQGLSAQVQTILEQQPIRGTSLSSAAGEEQSR